MHLSLRKYIVACTYIYIGGGSYNGGTQQPWIFLLKMIILGCFGGTTIFGNTHIYIYILYKQWIYIYIQYVSLRHVLPTFGPFFQMDQGDRNQRPKSMSFR